VSLSGTSLGKGEQVLEPRTLVHLTPGLGRGLPFGGWTSHRVARLVRVLRREQPSQAPAKVVHKGVDQ
jgi:hypothetical protein